ncbi:MAG: hypothetical protein U9N35_07645, partial [Euryarchaeota archaeon]|nr:hypothetical protein [Euryarchaeota archaeon]
MRIWGPLALLVIFSLCVSATPETETPEPTTTAPTSAAPPTPPPKEDLSAYENVPPEIITVIQEYDDDGELDDNELKYVELLNNDPSLFEYSKTISDKNLENLNTYWSFHNKNPSIEDYKEYMFENPEEFENGAFMDEYDNNFSLSDLISLREMTGKDVASGILDKIGDEEYKDLVLDYIMGDFTIDSKDSFVAGNIKHGLFNAIFEDESVENYEDDLVERLSKNREIERFNLEPKGKLEIYKLLFNERDNDFYRTVYDNLFD